MGSIGRYIFRTTLGAFLVICASVTALMWITQALRDIDLMTNQGQSILVFIGITGLIIPLLILIIASAKLAGALANKFGQPAVFGEILAGDLPVGLAVGLARSLAVGRGHQRVAAR